MKDMHTKKYETYNIDKKPLNMLQAREGFWKFYFRLLHRSITFASILWARWETAGLLTL